MARKPRVEFSGAFYHVISRGNQRRAIFLNRSDREWYLSRFESYRKRYGFTVYAYVLMRNHVHLLIETGRVPLSKIMQGLQFTYTRHYNRKYRKVGHLFQGRYKAILCDRDAYLMELARYVHLNPARTRRSEDPFSYPWSSHRAYLGEAGVVQVETSTVLGQFHRWVGPARQAYGRYMEEGLPQGHQARYYQVVDGRFLGDERFVEGMVKRGEARWEIEPGVRRILFTALLSAVCGVFGVSPGALTEPGRKRAWVRPRSLLVYGAREWGGMSVRELSRRLHRTGPMVSRLYAAYAADRDRVRERRALKACGEKVNSNA